MTKSFKSFVHLDGTSLTNDNVTLPRQEALSYFFDPKLPVRLDGKALHLMTLVETLEIRLHSSALISSRGLRNPGFQQRYVLTSCQQRLFAQIYKTNSWVGRCWTLLH